MKDLLRNHRPQILSCVTLIFRRKRVKVAWIYVNRPWCTHNLSQFGLELSPLVFETITYYDYQSVLHSLLVGFVPHDRVQPGQKSHTILADCEGELSMRLLVNDAW